MAGGNLFLTVVYTGLAVWILGLAMPVTASYIIAAVITAPAMIKLGVPDYAAHMFIFYYAVLSEVSPPTALSPFAAAAITGGNPYKTTMMAWKYTLPTFLVPFMFTLHPDGVGLLLKGPWEKYRLDERHRGSGIGRSRCGSYRLDANENDLAGARFIARRRVGTGLSESGSGRDRLGPFCVCRRAAVFPPPRGR